jgi:hypothetical protein
VVNATTPALRITQTGTGNALEVEDSANPDSSPFVVTAAGDVGIGTNAPGSKLDVLGGVSSTSDWGNVNITSRNAINSANRIYSGLRFQDSGASDAGAIGYSYNGTGYNMFFGTVASVGGAVTTRLAITSTGEFQWKPNGTTQAMTLDASGNLLVGGTSTLSSPTLNKGVYLQSSTNNDIVGYSLYVADGANSRRGSFFLDDNAGLCGLDFTASSIVPDMVFRLAGEKARITSGGDLLVGTQNSSETVNAGVRAYANGSISSTTADIGTFNFYNTTAAAYRFYVTNAGTIFATNTTISAISDQRLKENIQDLDVGLDKIMALKPRKFDWKEGKGKNIKGDRGWIAQEFEQVFPDMIDEWKDPAPEGEDPYKSVRADLIPVLVKAIQELKAEVDSLKAQLEAK